MARLDARAKAEGETSYSLDIERPGMLHAAVVRSTVAHGRVVGYDDEAARQVDGVVGVFWPDDVSANLFGRALRDVPILAREPRFVGDKIAAVVATTRKVAEKAADLVVVEYEELPAVFSPSEARRDGAPFVHQYPANYEGAVVSPVDGPNLQSRATLGELADAEAALSSAAFVVDETFQTPAGHHGYLEPHGCVAEVQPSGRTRIWMTNKSPYELRKQLGACFDRPPEDYEIEPVAIGGDFGGKGSPGDAPLCVELSRLTGRPVKLVLRYGEDLTATESRHPATIRVRAGCDEEGHLTGVVLDALLDGGAYGGFKPLPSVMVHGIFDSAATYRIPALYTKCEVAYTNTVPKGHMRAPGAPQSIFALESSFDLLAEMAKIDPIDFRRINLLQSGEPNAYGHTWVEIRGLAVLEEALKQGEDFPVVPGWRVGHGVALYSRETPTYARTSVRVIDLGGGAVRVEVPMPETGGGEHEVVRARFAAELDLSPSAIEIVQVATGELPIDSGVGHSRVTAAVTAVAEVAAEKWRDRDGASEIVVEIGPLHVQPVGSSCAQLVAVAVDVETGEFRVLGITTALDVATIVNEKAHQMQIDGGTTMGVGFACLEDLVEEQGQVWAANLGEFKIPSQRDVPPLRTVLVGGGRGVGRASVKAVGELSNVPTAAAIANALADATGVRLRSLPIRAEQLRSALEDKALRLGPK